MLPHQCRVLEEKSTVDARLNRLRDFMGSGTFRALEDEDKSLMAQQAEVMEQYSVILGKRIARF